MSQPINPSVITDLHKNCLIQWKAQGVKLQHQGFYQFVEENHAFNYQLWHAEDRARREDMGFEFVYQAKREIDHCNQQRNNRMESMDEWLYKTLEPAEPTVCPVNSESPGMMIDRLSILSLKAYHMALQVERQDVNEEHRQTCARKLATIQQQLNQLSQCLGDFLRDAQNKVRTFRVY
ncbi:MAG: DUF4254 domain-containing protein, partial [Legionella sp.]